MSSKLIKALASAHEDARDEAVKSVSDYVHINGSKLSKLDLEKLWKGLYFAVWFSDGAQNQLSLIEDLSRIFNATDDKTSVKVWTQYQEAFWKIIIKEWANIDQWRMDKYYLLIRRMVRGNFRYLQSKNWNPKVIESFNHVIRSPLELNKNMAIPYHLCDIYMEELDRVERRVADDALSMDLDLDLDLDLDSDSDSDRSDLDLENIKGKPEVSRKTLDQELENELDNEFDDNVDTNADTKADSEVDIPELVIQPFKDLMHTTKSKTLKAKITEEVLQSPISKKWWGQEEEVDEEEDEDEEWHGF